MAEVKLPKNIKWLKAMCELFPEEVLKKSKLYPACKCLMEKEKEEKAKEEIMVEEETEKEEELVKEE